MSAPDFRDLALEQLAVDEHRLRERVASLEADVESYRALAHEALAALAVMSQERDSYRRRLRQLQEEFAAFREWVLREAGIAA